MKIISVLFLIDICITCNIKTIIFNSFGRNMFIKYFQDKFKLPAIQVSAEMWVTLIEQFLMLILIIGRWMLPKGELTRDQLSQLLLVYIGIIYIITLPPKKMEFFDFPVSVTNFKEIIF